MSKLQGKHNARIVFNHVTISKGVESSDKTHMIRYLQSLPMERLRWILKLSQIGVQNTNVLATDNVDTLSKRETQVLVLVASGYSRSEISKSLTISPNTAARHIANTYGKLKISSVAEATMIAISTGLVAIDRRLQ